MDEISGVNNQSAVDIVLESLNIGSFEASVEYNGISSAAFPAINHLVRYGTTITTLNLCSIMNYVGKNTISHEKLFKPKLINFNPRLTSLNLSYTSLIDREATYLVCALSNKAMSLDLDLSKGFGQHLGFNDIGEEGAIKLASLLNKDNRELKKLNLGIAYNEEE